MAKSKPKSPAAAAKIAAPKVNRAAQHAKRMAKKARRVDEQRVKPRGATRAKRRANVPQKEAA
jgi:hypothetical protein